MGQFLGGNCPAKLLARGKGVGVGFYALAASVRVSITTGEVVGSLARGRVAALPGPFLNPRTLIRYVSSLALCDV